MRTRAQLSIFALALATLTASAGVKSGLANALAIRPTPTTLKNGCGKRLLLSLS